MGKGREFIGAVVVGTVVAASIAPVGAKAESSHQPDPPPGETRLEGSKFVSLLGNLNCVGGVTKPLGDSLTDVPEGNSLYCTARAKTNQENLPDKEEGRSRLQINGKIIPVRGGKVKPLVKLHKPL